MPVTSVFVISRLPFIFQFPATSGVLIRILQQDQEQRNALKDRAKKGVNGNGRRLGTQATRYLRVFTFTRDLTAKRTASSSTRSRNDLVGQAPSQFPDASRILTLNHHPYNRLRTGGPQNYSTTCPQLALTGRNRITDARISQ
jgi:hypothetical protein